MNTTFQVAGIVFVAAAIIGGGLEAFGVKVPLLHSVRRQVMLALFGGALLISAGVNSYWRKEDSGAATVQEGSGAATVQVTDALIQPVNNEHPKLLGIQAVAHLENVGKVPITAGCPVATAILQFLVPGPHGPQMTPSSWRLLGQQHFTAGQPCKVDLAVGESKTFPIYITFEKPSEDAVDVNVMVQFHKDAIPFGADGRDNSSVWIASAKARLP
jgi:hypothetical protein